MLPTKSGLALLHRTDLEAVIFQWLLILFLSQLLGLGYTTRKHGPISVMVGLLGHKAAFDLNEASLLKEL